MTLNEEVNLPACLDSVKDYADEIVVVDSFSTDRTLEIARNYTSKIYQHAFVNQAKQYIWAMEHADIRNEWVIRMDADERWTEEGFAVLRDIIAEDRADGVNVRMKIYFMGRWIRRGGMYPNLFLRVYKRSKGRIEDRWIDEHIRVEGRVLSPEIDVIESNYDRQKNIGLWTTKHNGYSTREAIEQLLSRHAIVQADSVADPFGNRTERKRWLKERFYARAPLFVRPWLYFLYRYFWKLGFLDGKEGFIFHTLHAFWYRFLVDTKIYQVEKIACDERKDVRTVIREHLGLEV
jgi:glycosyltransferase involved in cell wall biosynthesis